MRKVKLITSAKGIYIVPNQVDPALLSRAANRLRKTPKGESTADTNITRRRWLLVDCDAERPSGIGANDAEHEAAIERAREIAVWLSDQGWPDPVVADSGNGGHLLYAINLPADDDEIASRCLQALDDRFGDEVVKVDQSVGNPARIWKLYGTLACKGDDMPDRPHRMACILSTPTEVSQVPVDLLQALALAPEEVDVLANLFNCVADPTADTGLFLPVGLRTIVPHARA